MTDKNTSQLSTDDINEIFDSITLNDHHSVGFDEGYQKGLKEGEYEGFHYGYHQGSKIGAELGYYKGVVCTLLTLDKRNDIQISQKIRTVASKLLTLVDIQSTQFDSNTFVIKQISVIRSNYKQLCSLIKINGDIFNGVTDFSY